MRMKQDREITTQNRRISGEWYGPNPIRKLITQTPIPIASTILGRRYRPIQRIRANGENLKCNWANASKG